jgi:hypothetical protein
MATSTREEIGVGPLAIESLATGGRPHSLRCPARTGSQQAVLTGMFETTLRKTDKDSDVYGDWAGADAIKLRLELADGRAVITEYAPSGRVNGFDYGYSIFKDVIKFEGTGGSPSSARWSSTATGCASATSPAREATSSSGAAPGPGPTETPVLDPSSSALAEVPDRRGQTGDRAKDASLWPDPSRNQRKLAENLGSDRASAAVKTPQTSQSQG